MQAIITKYHGPTNTKGSRISAHAEAGSIIMARHYDLDIEADHRRVARALLLKFGWYGHWVQGAIPKSSGYVFVCSKTGNGPHEGFDVWKDMPEC